MFCDPICRVLQPYLLLWLIQYFAGQKSYTKSVAWLCAGGIGVVSYLTTFVLHLGYWTSEQLGMKMKLASCALLFRKVRYFFYIFVIQACK